MVKCLWFVSGYCGCCADAVSGVWVMLLVGWIVFDVAEFVALLFVF